MAGETLLAGGGVAVLGFLSAPADGPDLVFDVLPGWPLDALTLSDALLGLAALALPLFAGVDVPPDVGLAVLEPLALPA